MNLIPFSNCEFTEDAVTKALDNIKVNQIPGGGGEDDGKIVWK